MTHLLLVFKLALWLVAEGVQPHPWDLHTTVDAALHIGPQYGIDPPLLLAIAEVESGWVRTAGCAHDGHGCGLYQQVPAVSGRWGDDCWSGVEYVCGWRNGEGVTSEELLDVYRATTTAARHLAYLRDRYPDGWVGAYNTGPRLRHGDAAEAYTARVMRVYRRMRG